MAVTKGVSFLNTRTFVEERYGSGSWAQLLEGMEAGDREVIEPVLAVGWYDLAVYARMIRLVDRLFGEGNLDLLRPLGRFQAEQDLHTVYRLFFRFANPAYAIEKTTQYWRRFHDTGTWVIERKSPTLVTGTLEGWGVVDEALCTELTGYMPRVIELVGGRGAKMVHPQCRGRGSHACYFELGWRE